MSNLNKRRQLLSALLALTGAPLAYAAIDPIDLIRVYMIPMDDFPEEFAATIARFLQQKLNMRIKASLKIPALNMLPLPGTNQYSSEDILMQGKIATERLPEASAETFRLFLTMRDINSKSGNFRFEYASHNPNLNCSVISVARMFDLVDGKLKFTERTGARLAKMILRTIGEMQLGWKRNSDQDDLMYAPIMGMDDLDRIGFEHKPNTEYVMQILEPVGGKITRPKEWHYAEDHHENSFTWTLSKENISTGQPYMTGVKIQILTGIKAVANKTAREFLFDFAEKKKKSVDKVIKVCEESEQGLFKKICIETEEGPFRILYSLSWGADNMDLAVITIAGTKKELWDTYSPVFNKMSAFELIDMKRFNHERHSR